MNLAGVRTGLKTALETIDGLRVYDFEVDLPVFPAAVVRFPETINVPAVLGGGWDYTIPITLLLERGSAQATDDLLETLLAEDGDRSIVAAIHADPTLGGACDSAAVREVTNFDYPTIGRSECVACEIMVEVMT